LLWEDVAWKKIRRRKALTFSLIRERTAKVLMSRL